MIGVYDYTVILTYLSLLSGAMGIIVSMSGIGHPFIGMYFLLFSGLCDTFDGIVARTKKNRTQIEKDFGVQIDSFADLIAFGVLPVSIGIAMLRISTRFTYIPKLHPREGEFRWYPVLFLFIAFLYILAAVIRLSYFNVTEDERAKEKAETGRSSYTGLPVTSASLIFPFVLLLHYILDFDLSVAYFCVMLLTGFLFLGRFKIKKPGKKMLTVLILIGIIEFILALIVKFNIVDFGFPGK